MRPTVRHLLAILFAFALIAVACGGDDDDEAGAGDDTGAEQNAPDEVGAENTEAAEEATEELEEEGEPPATGTTIAYGYAQEFSNYNNNLAASNSVANSIIVNEVLPDPFFFAGPTGDLVMDEELMVSVTAVSEDPQVIEYVVDPDAAWSDGDPIDCDDFYFYWQSHNGTWPELDENGEPVLNRRGREVRLFKVTGSSGYDAIESMDCSDDGKTITVTFSEVFADWRALFSSMLPAHVVERETGVDDLIAAFDAGDTAAITAVGEFYNDAWAMDPGELLDPALIPSGDKMVIGSWEAGSSLTLVPNPDYWGTPANGPVVVRYIAEEAQAQALANGEINAMDPQPSPDLLAQLEGIDGVVVETGSLFDWEHFDFNLNTVFGDRAVREAFALCLPRAQMVANLIQPLDPTAEILNNRFNLPFEAGYVDNSGGLYQEVDLERAQELLDESGIEQPVTVRVGWLNDGNNARRADQAALAVESCNQVEGFDVVDNGSETFFEVELFAGDWDVAMFAWSGSPLKTISSEVYRSGGGLNFGGYANPEVDELLDAINSELDAQTQVELSNEVDAILWEDLVTIPVFAFPGVAAYSENASNVILNPSQNGLTWNAGTWQIN